LVQEHLRAAGKLTSGLAALPGVASAFASTQAAWRFYANPRVPFAPLAQPLLDAARQAVAAERPDWGLVVHDRSVVSYPRHAGKTDQTELGNGRGYELVSALLVSGQAGDPIAPLELRWRTAAAVYSTRADARDVFWLDQVGPTMGAVQALGLACRLVHVLDREGDSVGHFRRWAQAGHRFLVRADAEPKVHWEAADLPLGEVAQRLAERGALRFSRTVDYHGRPARQEVAETAVVLTRPAWQQGGGPEGRTNYRVPGAPLALRLVVSRVFDERGALRAEWLLLTNVPAEVSAETVALWYYWRWRIESYFKLLKSAGQQWESWQQERGEALAKRLAVASMACVVVWRLARQPSPEAAAARQALVRLSGRQMKWGVESTAPALLAGLWVLLAALAALEHYSEAELRAMKDQIIHSWDTG
jgi:hypothetical protein